MNMTGILSLLSNMLGGKAADKLKKAVDIANSGKYTPDMAGAMKLAKDYGFDKTAFEKMEGLSRNPKVQQAVSLIAPGASDKLQAMFNQLRLSMTNGSPMPSLPQERANSSMDDFSARLKRLTF